MPQSGEVDFADLARPGPGGAMQLELMVPEIHCAGCIARIESTLRAHPAVTAARVNMSSKRVTLSWLADQATANEFAARIEALGFSIQPVEAGGSSEDHDKARGRELLSAMAIAGFAAGNIMLLSVSVWSGAPDATRALFHWLSALIAIPAVAYAGRPFFRSAWAALKARSLNMDMPISLAVVLACGMSFYETARGGQHTYFDAAVMLLFFLLVGRYLDHQMRARAHSALSQLKSLTAKSALVVQPGGTRLNTPIADITTGMTVFVGPDTQVPVDGVILSGSSDIDVSAMTGESIPQPVFEGATVHEGTINLTGELDIQVSASYGDTLLASIVAMMEQAETTKARYVRLADIAARIYAPMVHGIAALTFFGWLWASNGDWHLALVTAIAVLIITCPCALGLAVPVVQTVATGVLFRNGILLKDGAALERLAQVDTVVFDKTGTLTLGRPQLVPPAVMDIDQLAIAAGLALHSNHPLSRAITALAAQRNIPAAPIDEVVEQPGAGLHGSYRNTPVRLGSRTWCTSEPAKCHAPPHQLEICLKVGNAKVHTFRFEDELRSDAKDVVADLQRRNLPVALVSGDRPHAVAHVARTLGIANHLAPWSTEAKASYVTGLNNSGRKVLMVGDGLNDAPALASAHASMAPSSATDAGRTAADLVFLGDRLTPILIAHDVAKRARRLVMQNFSLALGYNLIAVPLAVCGYASPLVAAVAMSSSSLLVTANALRLRLHAGPAGKLSNTGPAAAVAPHDTSRSAA